jgi:acetyltransferase-like isoleucine patch superfamily enzyme
MLSRTAYVDPSASVHRSVNIWHFAVVLESARLSENASVGSHAEIGAGAFVGVGSRIGAGVFLPANSLIGKNVFIGPRTVFTDDRMPKANNRGYKAEPPIVEDDAVIGAGCVILPGVVIGARAIIGAGSIVTKSVPAGMHVRGQPARTAVLSSLSPAAEPPTALLCEI